MCGSVQEIKHTLTVMLKIFASGGVDFGQDDAGSICTRFGFGKCELHNWAE